MPFTSPVTKEQRAELTRRAKAGESREDLAVEAGVKPETIKHWVYLDGRKEQPAAITIPPPTEDAVILSLRSRIREEEEKIRVAKEVLKKLTRALDALGD